MGWSSPHAVEATINSIPGLSGGLAATFTNLSYVAPQNQAASYEAGVNQSRAGLEQAKDVRVALASAVKDNPDAAPSAGNSGGPSLIREGMMGVGAMAVSAAMPQFAPALSVFGMLNATVGAIKTLSSNPIDQEYTKSSFRSAAESAKPSRYADFEGRLWEADGSAIPEGQGKLSTQPQPQLMVAAQNVVGQRGSESVMKDLAKASKAEDRLQEQLGSNLEFAEKNMGIKTFKSGPAAPSWAVA